MAAAAPRRSGAGRALRAGRRDPLCGRLSVSQAPRTQLPARINLIHRETLCVVEEELLVSSARQKLWQFRGFRGGKDEDVGVVRDAVGAVVNHVLVAVEGETVVEITADVMHGDDLVGGVSLVNLAGQRTRRVRDVEEMAVDAEQEEHERGERNE